MSSRAAVAAPLGGNGLGCGQGRRLLLRQVSRVALDHCPERRRIGFAEAVEVTRQGLGIVLPPFGRDLLRANA
jgi:hypothetical protein